jgi:hypothetical protein
MKKIIILLLIAVSSLVYADHGWERVNYMQSTIFSAEVTVNNKPALADDVVGAFVNNECRMIAKVFMVGDKAYVSSVIHGDSPEQVEFRLWLHQKDSIVVSPQKVATTPGGSLLHFSLNFVMK